jgi:hypothetical protein
MSVIMCSFVPSAFTRQISVSSYRIAENASSNPSADQLSRKSLPPSALETCLGSLPSAFAIQITVPERSLFV